MSEPILRTRNSGFGGSGYAIPTEVIDGKPRIIPGITTVTSVIDKPAIVQYQNDAIAAKAVVSIDALLNRTEEEGFRFLRYAGSYANKDAMQNGTVVHEWVETHLTGGLEPELENVQQEQMVSNFIDWLSNNDVEPLLNEATVYNPEAGYAGTLDLIAKVNGVGMLMDAKTGKGIYPEHFMQLAALGACPVLMREVEEGNGALYETKSHGKTYWVEDVVPPFTEYAILHIRPDDWDSRGNAKGGFCELETIPQWKIDAYYEAFLGALKIKQTEREVKRLEKVYEF